MEVSSELLDTGLKSCGGAQDGDIQKAEDGVYIGLQGRIYNHNSIAVNEPGR